MKNKILSYVLGGLLVLPMGLIMSYVHAGDCVCPDGDPGCKLCNYPSGGNPPADEPIDGGELDEVVITPEKGGCKGIKLNTNFPIIGNCIGDNEDATKVFPSMIGALTKIVMSLILVVCFILIIVAGIMWAGDNPGQWKGGGAKGLLAKVAITILLLGFSGVILKLINPNFFNS